LFEFFQGLQGFLYWNIPVGPVELVEVHIIGSEVFEAPLTGLAEFLSGEVRGRGFGCNDDFVSFFAQGFGDELLRVSVSVSLGRVKEVNARIIRC